MKLLTITGEELAKTTQQLPLALRRFCFPWSKPLFYEYDFGRVLAQELHLRGFNIFSWKLYIDKQVTLFPAAEKPIIALQFTLKGNIPCLLTGFGSKLLQEGSYELFYVPARVNEVYFEPGEFESLHIELDPGYLSDIAVSYAAVSELLLRFNASSEKGIPMSASPIHFITARILGDLKNCRQQGGMLQFDMHKYVVELLSEYMDAILRSEHNKPIGYSPYKETLLQIKYFIEAAPNIHAHTLEKLAARFLLSGITLKRHFRRSFGMTVSQFVREQALAKARHLLTTTFYSVEYIADEIGYSERVAFEKAFKKHFGFWPSSLRS